MVDDKNKSSVSPKANTIVTSNQSQKQTQSYPNSSQSQRDSKGAAYGGKLQQREQDVRDISDDQIAGMPSYNRGKNVNSSSGISKK